MPGSDGPLFAPVRMPLTQLLEAQTTEPILDTHNRQLAFHISDPDLWDLYERQFGCFWQPKEIEPSRDVGWEELNADEQRFISTVLAFFATADSVVFDNIDLNFSREVVVTEAKFFYGMQGFMENIHSQVYMSLLQAYVKDDAERERLTNAIQGVPTISRKAAWAMKHFDGTVIPFAMRLIAFSIVEGVFFSSAFASIFWLKKYKKGMLSALTLSNAFIARDEALHTEFAVALFHRLRNRPLQVDVHALFTEAVTLEEEYVDTVLHASVIGLDAAKLCTYVRFVADRLLAQLGYDALFHADNPLSFMETQSLRVSTNFFESRVHEYALAQPGHYADDAYF